MFLKPPLLNSFSKDEEEEKGKNSQYLNTGSKFIKSIVSELRMYWYVSTSEEKLVGTESATWNNVNFIPITVLRAYLEPTYLLTYLLLYLL